MPAGDKTGPTGNGPMTGRGAGYCAGYDSPGFASAPGANFGARGQGAGRGGGRRGRRNQFHATGLYGWQRDGMGAYERPALVDPAPSTQVIGQLEQQLNRLESAVAAIRSRLDEVQKQDS